MRESPITKNNIQDLMLRGIAVIGKSQNEDGGFPSLSRLAQGKSLDSVAYKTTFFPSIILSCLITGQKAAAAGSLERFGDLEIIGASISNFLRTEMKKGGSWNYWADSSREKKTMTYPDDLDDTFAALAALHGYDANLIDGTVLASVTKMLTALEIQGGGPYKTWLVGPDATENWKDVDVVVNSNIAYFLSLIGVHLPNLERFIDNAIENSCLTSPYYPGIFQVAYFVSRSYKGKHRAVLERMLIEKLRENEDSISPLERAMAISALINLESNNGILGEEVAKLIQGIERGGWKPYSFCIDPSRDGKKCFAGSSALTAAFCVEALAKYLELKETEAPKESQQETAFSQARTEFFGQTNHRAQEECQALGPTLRPIAEKCITAQTDEKIILLAYDFKEALKGSHPSIPLKTIGHLALVNLYGWLSYTIYDDFLDDEGDPQLLSAAHFFSRKLSAHYRLAAAHVPEAEKLFEVVMNQIDEANTWEQAHCRVEDDKKTTSRNIWDNLPDFENYENLAHRSMGHALGPLTELLSAGHDIASQEFKAIEGFFENYLIARQLHDDAHDWEEDLHRGRINSVAALILKKYNTIQKEQQENLDVYNSDLKKLFWKKNIDDVVEIIMVHIKKARHMRDASGLFANTAFMEKTLSSLEQGAQDALVARDETLRFLKEYETVNQRG